MISLGIDIGSRNTKIAIFDRTSSAIVFSAWDSTAADPRRTVQSLLEKAREATGGFDPFATACTGYGRKLYSSQARVLSEISCHAAGVCHWYPQARTIIDVGGQDSKIIALSPEGKVMDFAMNDKCAAGTGRFLEMTALRLGLAIGDLSSLAAQSSGDLHISSTCVVFAESEIIGLLSANSTPADIARAVHISVAKRIVGQLSALDHQAPFVFTGGVAQNADLVHCLAEALQSEILVPPDPEITGAMGAAILA